MNTTIEICAESLESCIAARSAGAHRIELCSALILGGITPSYGAIAQIKKEIELDINVLIRPRGGNFLYNRDHMEVMRKDIETCANLKVAGVVFGALDKYGNIDLEFCKPLAKLAKSLNLSFTFHRAIDVSANLLKSVEEVISLGAQRILTSGGAETAFEGLPNIKKMASLASGRIAIMPGSGINATNIAELAIASNYLGLAQVHLSASQEVPSPSLHKSSLNFTHSELGGDYINKITSEQKIKDAIKALSYL